VSQDRFDVVIVGGAAIGSSVAYFLTHDLPFAGTVAVIERDPTYAHAATTLSVASIRQQFSTAESIRMSRFGIAFIKGFKERFGRDADIAFREGGYLLLATERGRAVLSANAGLQQAEGADVVLMAPAALARRFAFLRTDDLAAGAYGQSGEGWFDGHSLLDLLRRQARRKGVAYLNGEVSGITRRHDRIAAVTLADGRQIGCGILVNAAGPQAGDVAALAGVALPVEPRKRCVFVVSCRAELAAMPLIVDPGGVWVRPEGGVYLCGVSPPQDADPRDDGFDVTYALFDDVVWPALAHRIPAMQALKLERAWAGHYDFNPFDHNAILGPHSAVENLLFANGFSGHGLQHAPAVGRAIAELIVHGRYVSLDLAVFGYARIADGRPLRELNVI